jgi:hypothetical protein
LTCFIVGLKQVGCTVAKAKAVSCGKRELSEIPLVPFAPLDRYPGGYGDVDQLGGFGDVDQAVSNTSPDDPSGHSKLSLYVSHSI